MTSTVLEERDHPRGGCVGRAGGNRVESQGEKAEVSCARDMTDTVVAELTESMLSLRGIREQDYVAIVGQGQYVARTDERLCASDVGMTALTSLWRRAMEDLEVRPQGTPRANRQETRPDLQGKLNGG